ncbi:A disintegrin and metalloproteinase with thrombospondin motifs 12-like [Periplaneta americana]|uniref:A disintegrin and metalloproteinase with thrombospondin motifs 12-like n=1 Tax=Periplaneta americana TaxID=6978 RepID=UPI0037E7B3A1
MEWKTFAIVVNLLCALGSKPLLQGRYSRNIEDFEVVVPERVTSNGQFISHLIPYHYKHSYYQGKSEEDMGPDDTIHYSLPISGEEHHLELWPNNRLLSPGFVVETRPVDGVARSRRHKRNSATDYKFHRLRDVQCLYRGRVRGHNDSVIALSTCYGLAGLIKTRKGYCMIEPAEGYDPLSGGEQRHLVYRANKYECKENCGTKGEVPLALANRKIREIRRYLSKRSDNTHENMTKISHNEPLNVEILLVLDKTLIHYHENRDVENYILTVMNMAYNLFHDASLGALINLVIVKIIRLEVEEDEMNLSVTKDAERTLDTFCRWQKRMNPGDDDHPNHHDVAVLITRTDICADEDRCGILGISKLAGTCDPDISCCVCEDSGLKLGYGIAHELAHSLGIDHDDENVSGCNGTLPDGMHTVMYPTITMKIKEWSNCSRDYLQTFINSGFASCLMDLPSDHDFNMVDILPGVMYDADFQCQTMLSSTSAECAMGLTCDSLNCEIPGYGCVKTHIPPAPGTACGENRWCYNRKCLNVGERPGAEDGGWGQWSEWSLCSRTCGSGIASSERHCNNPMPRSGGKNCVGNRKRHRICSSEPCSAFEPSFRDVQCSEFDNWVFPEDGKVHKWKGHFVREGNPCKLVCKSDNGVVAVLKKSVTDGTVCFRGIRDICIGGVCREIPCDLDFESEAVEDRCGVCHGDGGSCNITDGTMFFQEDKTAPKKMLDVLVGARNIYVEEAEPTDSLIVVTKQNSTEELIGGDKLGMYTFAGTKAWLGMIKDRQEALLIVGPVTEPLVIWVKPLENVTLQYSMGISTDEKRTLTFYWDFLGWSKCSAHCGPGTQVSKARCVEKEAGLVEDRYCNASGERPPVKSRPCEIAPCVTRWSTSTWQKCYHTNTTACKRIRVVNCVKPIGEGEGETDIVPDNICVPPKPQASQPCDCGHAVKNGVAEKSQYARGDEMMDRNSIQITGKLTKNHKRTHSKDTSISEIEYVPSKSITSNLNNFSDSDEDEVANKSEDINFQTGELKHLQTSKVRIKKSKRGCVKDYEGKKKTEHDRPTASDSLMNDSQKLHRGRTIIDKEGKEETKITIILDKNAGDSTLNVKLPAELPGSTNSETSLTLDGNDTLHFVQKLQATNTTRNLLEIHPRRD